MASLSAKHLAAWSLAVGAVSAAASVSRVVIVNHQAFESLLWAEDGAFPLCVRKASVLTCWFDPFAGYLLTGPRLLAGLVAPWPMSAWPVVTNLLAAVIAGILSAWVCFVATRGGVRLPFAILLAVIPVLAPIVGLEAVNAIGSIYLPLLYACSIVIVVGGRRLGARPLAIVLLITALTMPMAVLLLLPLVLLTWRGRLAVRTAVLGSLGILLGLLAQLVVILIAPARRASGASLSTLSEWVQALPGAVLTDWPGMTDNGAFLFERFPITAFPFTALVLLVAVVLLIVMGLRSTHAPAQSSALLLLLGLAFSLIPTLLPSVAGAPGNRYYVLLVLLWSAAFVIWLDAHSARWARWVPWAVLVGVAVLWWPMFPASQFRHESDPSWSSQLAAARAACADGAPNAVVTFEFSPTWPHRDTILHEPTTNVAPCAALVGDLS